MSETQHSPIVQLGLIQARCTEDRRANLDSTLAEIAIAVERGAQIVCLQELFRTRYFCRSQDHAAFGLAETADGETAEALSDAARRHSCVIVGSIFERRAAGLHHNSLLIFDEEGRRLAVYRKMHIPDDPGFFEKFYFSPGDAADLEIAGGAGSSRDGFASVHTRHAEIGPLVCWDQWYPEAARITALLGAEILIYPTAIGWLSEEKEEHGAAQLDAWKTIQRSHAIANGVFVASVNRVGVEGDIEFWGSSFVCDPFGRVLAEASPENPGILVVPCDLRLVGSTRCEWPFLRDRRIDAYGGLTSRFLDR